MLTRLFSERALIALILLLIASALTYSTFGLEFADLGGAFDPTFFPRIILIAWMALAALNLIVDLRAGTGWDGQGILRVAIMAVATVIYMVFLTTLGFFFSSVILSVLFLLLLGVRNPLPIAAVSLGVPGALVALFNHMLTMPLPTSPMFWWI
ncbi:MAG: tripartite tricarboxylate transporter TctB family protein [Pseudomonadota bacterium]